MFDILYPIFPLLWFFLNIKNSSLDELKLPLLNFISSWSFPNLMPISIDIEILSLSADFLIDLYCRTNNWKHFCWCFKIHANATWSIDEPSRSAILPSTVWTRLACLSLVTAYYLQVETVRNTLFGTAQYFHQVHHIKYAHLHLIRH